MKKGNVVLVSRYDLDSFGVLVVAIVVICAAFAIHGEKMLKLILSDEIMNHRLKFVVKGVEING